MDFITPLLGIITNPYVLGILGLLGLGGWTYFKGKTAGKQSVENALRDAEDRQKETIKRAEKINQEVEQERNQNAETINDAAGDIAKLVELLNKAGQAPGSDTTDKK